MSQFNISISSWLFKNNFNLQIMKQVTQQWKWPRLASSPFPHLYFSFVNFNITMCFIFVKHNKSHPLHFILLRQMVFFTVTCEFPLDLLDFAFPNISFALSHSSENGFMKSTMYKNSHKIKQNNYIFTTNTSTWVDLWWNRSMSSNSTL